MTKEEKLKKLKKLADAMYYAAQYLTTDASQLHKAMDEYHKFIIHECKEEPISDVWHDMSEEAENGRNIIIIDPKDFYGAVLRKGGSQLRNHNKERYVKWAYIDDIINVTNKEEPVSEELEEASRNYADNEEYGDDVYFAIKAAFKVGAKWQLRKTRYEKDENNKK